MSGSNATNAGGLQKRLAFRELPQTFDIEGLMKKCVAFTELHGNLHDLLVQLHPIAANWPNKPKFELKYRTLHAAYVRAIRLSVDIHCLHLQVMHNNGNYRGHPNAAAVPAFTQFYQAVLDRIQEDDSWLNEALDELHDANPWQDFFFVLKTRSGNPGVNMKDVLEWCWDDSASPSPEDIAVQPTDRVVGPADLVFTIGDPSQRPPWMIAPQEPLAQRYRVAQPNEVAAWKELVAGKKRHEEAEPHCTELPYPLMFCQSSFPTSPEDISFTPVSTQPDVSHIGPQDPDPSAMLDLWLTEYNRRVADSDDDVQES